MGLGADFDALLVAAQSGAEWALTSLYQDLHPAILRYLRAQEPKEADDLASETWLDVASGLTRFHGDERDFRKWVFTIARRRMVDFRRRAFRRRTYPVPVEQLEDLPSDGDVEGEAVESAT